MNLHTLCAFNFHPSQTERKINSIRAVIPVMLIMEFVPFATLCIKPSNLKIDFKGLDLGSKLTA